jgi:hypothetical protein
MFSLQLRKINKKLSAIKGLKAKDQAEAILLEHQRDRLRHERTLLLKSVDSAPLESSDAHDCQATSMRSPSQEFDIDSSSDSSPSNANHASTPNSPPSPLATAPSSPAALERCATAMAESTPQILPDPKVPFNAGPLLPARPAFREPFTCITTQTLSAGAPAPCSGSSVGPGSVAESRRPPAPGPFSQPFEPAFLPAAAAAAVLEEVDPFHLDWPHW